MSKKKKKQLTFVEAVRLIHKAGLEGKSTHNNGKGRKETDMDTLRERIKIILNIVEKPYIKTENMLYFVMYDIQNNKIRNLIIVVR